MTFLGRIIIFILLFLDFFNSSLHLNVIAIFGKLIRQAGLWFMPLQPISIHRAGLCPTVLRCGEYFPIPRIEVSVEPAKIPMGKRSGMFRFTLAAG